MKPLRLIDLQTVPYLRSQAIYHGLAHALRDGTPDTIVLATPARPYACIGYHQDLGRELDLEFCRRAGLPVVRRETGGGAVYLDSRQLFVQWVMRPTSLPLRVERRFELFCRPLVETYRALGVAASFRPINDVHVEGRKISGTGAARIGDAEVLTGNFLFDFDTDRMARVVRAPSEAFREQVERSLLRYMTSMRRELGRAPARERVADRYVDRCAAALGREPVPGELTDAELLEVERSERRLGDRAFVARPGGLRRPGLKIHADVYVVESAVQHAGGPVRMTARTRQGRIEDLALSPAEHPGLDGLEAALRGVELEPRPVRRALESYNAGRRAGLEVAVWTRALLELAAGDRP